MIFADFHAHPFLRPFQNRDNDADLMSNNPNDISSVWNEYDLPKDSLRHIIGEHAGFTSYSQSDFTEATRSSMRLIAVSLYPAESNFFQFPNSSTFDKIIDFFKLKEVAEIELGHIVSSFSKEKIRQIKSSAYDYFQDLLKQFKYFEDALPFCPDSAQCVGTIYSQIKNAVYTIIQNGSDIQLINSDPVIQIFLNIEGGHCFWSNTTFSNGQTWNGRNFSDYVSNEDLQKYQVMNVADFRNSITRDIVENNPESMNQIWSTEACDMVLQNVRLLIENTKIFSLTLSHHFYNGLCGHCDSLQPLTDLKLSDQSFGKDSDITHLGYLVINELLKNNILIDVKHMSWKGRQSYYRFRSNNYPNIPIMWSHAAVSGRKKVGDSSVDTWTPNPFYQEAINLYDDDIFETVRSHGLIGIEFDQRVNGVKYSKTIDTLWKNFQYIVELAATLDRNASETVWDNVCLGTDFDGVIHPVDQFKTYESLPEFDDFLLIKIKDYMKNPPLNFLSQDKIEPEEILAKLCFKNLVTFVKKNFV